MITICWNALLLIFHADVCIKELSLLFRLFVTSLSETYSKHPVTIRLIVGRDATVLHTYLHSVELT